MNKSKKVSIEELFKSDSFSSNLDQATIEKMKITACDGVHGKIPDFVLERVERKFTDKEIEEVKKRLDKIRKSKEK